MSRTKQTGQAWYERLPVGTYQYYLVFDTETTTDEKQSLRFGVYELHGKQQWKIEATQDISLDTCDELLSRGLFYNAGVMQASEIALLEQYALVHSYACFPVEKFISLFYVFSHNKTFYTCVIGHNLPFDLSRLMQEVQFPKHAFKNGFSLKLCNCQWTRKGRKRSIGDSCKMHPSIKIKKISPKASIFEFADRKPRGCFVDTATLARALLGPGSSSLESLGNMLGIAEKKLTEQGEHGQTLTEEYIQYAVRDVQATWQIFQKLRAIYASYNFSQKMHYIFSEASLGKALYKQLGITSPMARMQDIPPELHGYAMTTYYGGRSEVHMRKEEVQIAYCDFKSQYPTVFSLMGLQDMLLAESYEIQDVTENVQDTLQRFTLDWLRYPEYWPVLRVLCKISGSDLILPVRAQFNGVSNNIALCNCEISGTWYTLADVLASVLLGGAIPTIEEAIEVIPHGRIETTSLDMFDGLIQLDPSQHGIFTTLINERTRIKKAAKQTQDPSEREKLERTQLALKLLANSTSYGINIELRTEELQDDLLLYGNDGKLQAASSEMQQPGTFYCPLIGTHIPAGGRLLLAIAQCLGRARGLSYAMCDTDSMSFVKPSDMSHNAFKAHVSDIISWFKPLYPYNDQGELFELEDVNKWEDELEPLYFLGVSAKRYVLYNKGLGSIRIRKASSHGLGAFRVSDSYKSPAWIPAPDVSLKELGLTKHTKWIYDLWYEHVKLYQEYGASAAMMQPLWERPALSSPAYQQTVLATAYLYKLFSHVPGMKPFNFVTTFFSFTEQQLQARIDAYPEQAETYRKITSSMYVPYTTHMEAIRVFYVIKSNTIVVNIHPLTVEEVVQGYFDHPEYKAANGHFDGEMRMHRVKIVGYIPMGKESSYEVLELEDSGLPTGLAREAIDMEYMSDAQWQSLTEQARDYGVNAMAKKLGMPAPRVSEMLASKKPPKQSVLQQLKQAL